MKQPLWNFSNDQLVAYATQELQTFKNETQAGVIYKSVQPKDLVEVSNYLQRYEMSDPRAKALRQEITASFNQSNVRIGAYCPANEKPPVKTIQEVENLKNGYGMYNNNPANNYRNATRINQYAGVQKNRAKRIFP